MVTAPRGPDPNAVVDPLVTYVAELELEVDRLRRQAEYVEQTTCDAMQRIRRVCADQRESPVDSSFSVIASVSEAVAHLVLDLHESLGNHPAHDQVTRIPIRPLAEQVFRWQQRLSGNPRVTLHLETNVEDMDWFPVRLRHVLDGLLSDALDSIKSSKGEARVALDVRRVEQSYELRVSDNGPDSARELESGYEHRMIRAADLPNLRLRSNLEAVALLVKQSGGSLMIETGRGFGTCRFATLPRFDAGDFLDPN